MEKEKDIIQYWLEKRKEYYKPLNTKASATQIILNFISEMNLYTMWDIYCTLRFMLSELPIYPYPSKRVNAIIEELKEIEYLNIEDGEEIINFIDTKIKKAIKKRLQIAKLYRKSWGLNRDHFFYRHIFPETFLSESKNKENFPLYCLLYFFDYAMPDCITFKEIAKIFEQRAQSKGKSYIFTEKLSRGRQNVKWTIVKLFLKQQLGIEKDENTLLKMLHRYGRFVGPVYKYIYNNFPHGYFLFWGLPEYSCMYIFEGDKYIGTRFIFFKPYKF